MADRVNESVKTGVLITLGLIRGPEAAPQEGAAGGAAGAAEASEGNADSDSVSNSLAARGGWGVSGEGRLGESVRAGKGSGAPSSPCLFYRV